MASRINFRPANDGLSGLRDAFTGAPLDPSRGLYRCKKCAAYYHESSVSELRVQNNAECLNCKSRDLQLIAPAARYQSAQDNAPNRSSGQRTQERRNPAKHLVIWLSITVALAILMALIWEPEPATDTAPTLVLISPADNAVNVLPSASLVLTFSEEVQAGVGFFRVRSADGRVVQTFSVSDSQVHFRGSTVSIDPAVEWPAQTGLNLQVDFGAIRDLAGNPFVGIQSGTRFSFYTGSSRPDSVAPTLSFVSPSDNSIGVAPAVSIVLRYSETVRAGAGSISIVTDGGAAIRVISIQDQSQIMIVGEMVTVNPSSDLPSGTSMHLLMPAGLVKDLSGNPSPGVNSPIAFSFVTRPQTIVAPPLSVNPAPAQSNGQRNMMASTSLNVRDGPGTQYAIQRTIASGQSITVTRCLADYSWCEVRLQSRLGWASGRFLVDGQGDSVAKLGTRSRIPIF